MDRAIFEQTLKSINIKPRKLKDYLEKMKEFKFVVEYCNTCANYVIPFLKKNDEFQNFLFYVIFEQKDYILAHNIKENKYYLIDIDNTEIYDVCIKIADKYHEYHKDKINKKERTQTPENILKYLNYKYIMNIVFIDAAGRTHYQQNQFVMYIPKMENTENNKYKYKYLVPFDIYEKYVIEEFIIKNINNELRFEYKFKKSFIFVIKTIFRKDNIKIMI